MNKQELIDVLKKYKNGYQEETDGYFKGAYDAYGVALGCVKKLDEQPKVTVPQFLDKYIQENKGECASDVFSEEWLYDSADELDDEVDKWLYENDGTENDRRYLIAVQAFVTGEYEVEKEPKFIVKVGSLYLIEPLGDTSDSTIRTTWNHKNAYEFTSYDMAQTHANKFGGEVEEVK